MHNQNTGGAIVQPDRPRIIGYVNGRAVYEIAGGSEPAPEQSSGQGFGQDVSQAPADTDPGDLLADDADDTGDDDADFNQQQQQQDDGDQESRIAQRVADQMSKTIADQVQSTVDRRVNQLVNKGKVDTGQQQQQQQPAQTPDQTDQQSREARSVLRESLGDKLRMSAEEKKLARTIGAPIVQQLIADGNDPDSAGESAAGQVEQEMKRIRSHYATRTKAALKRQGLLADEPSGGPQTGPTGTANKKRQDSAIRDGSAMADRIMAKRHPEKARNKETT